jgi:16S rRNA (guanine966-N2)-methyltransferase
MNSVRIIGGQWRGRRISFNPAGSVRPTPDRVRETLFNWLMGRVAGARCLDLFAGSGILGLEALSRGAAFLCSVEKDSVTVEGIKTALQHLKADPARWQLAQADALPWLRVAAHTPAVTPSTPFDLIFVDPPYEVSNLYPESLRLIKQQALLAAGGIVYLESNRPIDETIIAEGFQIYKNKRISSVYAYLIFVDNR